MPSIQLILDAVPARQGADEYERATSRVSAAAQRLTKQLAQLQRQQERVAAAQRVGSMGAIDRAAIGNVERLRVATSQLQAAQQREAQSAQLVNLEARRQAREMERASRQVESLRSSFGGAERAQVQFARGQRAIGNALRTGAIAESEAARLRQRLAANTTDAAVRGRDLRVVLGDLAAQSGATAGPVGRLATSVGTLARSIGPVGLAGAIAALAATGGLVVLGRVANQTARDLDQLIKQADALGISLGGLQRLQFVGVRTGVDNIDRNLGALSRRLGEALDGTGEAKQALDALGLSAQQLEGLDLEGQLAAIADAFQSIEDPTRRSAVAADLFSRAGLDMVRVLTLGSDGLGDLSRRAEELGLVLDEDAARQAERVRDRFAEFELVTERLKQRLGAELLPVLESVGELLVTVASAAGQAFAAFQTSDDPRALEIEALEARRRDLDAQIDALRGAGASEQRGPSTFFGALLGGHSRAVQEARALRDLERERLEVLGEIDTLRKAIAADDRAPVRASLGAPGPDTDALDARAKAIAALRAEQAQGIQQEAASLQQLEATAEALRAEVDARRQGEAALRAFERAQFVATTVREAEIRAAERNLDLLPQTREEYARLAGAVFDARTALSQLAEQEKRTDNELANRVQRLGDNLQDSLAGSIRGALDDSEDFFEDFFDRVLDLAKDTFAQVAAFAILQPGETINALGQIFGALGGEGAQAGAIPASEDAAAEAIARAQLEETQEQTGLLQGILGAFGGGGGGGAAGGVGTAVGSAANASLIASAALLVGSLATEFGGNALSGDRNEQRKGQIQLVSLFVGPLFGLLIKSLLSGARRSQIQLATSERPDDPIFSTVFDDGLNQVLSQETPFGFVGFNRNFKQRLPDNRNLLDQIAQFDFSVASFLDRRQTEIIASALQQFEGGTFSFRTFDPPDLGLALADRVNFVIQQLVADNPLLKADQAETIAGRFQQVQGGDPQSVLDNFRTFTESLDALEDGLRLLRQEEVNEAAQSIRELEETFASLLPVIGALGVEIGVLEDALETGLSALRENFLADFADRILAIEDPLAAALGEIERARQEALENAQVLGAETVLLERFFALERQRTIEQFVERANSSIRGLLDQLTGSPGSPLPTQEALGNAQQRFAEAFEQSLAGDLEAREALAQAARDVLGLREELFGATAAFFQGEFGFNAITGQIQQILDTLPTGVSIPTDDTGAIIPFPDAGTGGGGGVASTVVTGVVEIPGVSTAAKQDELRDRVEDLESTLDAVLSELRAMRRENGELRSLLERQIAAA